MGWKKYSVKDEKGTSVWGKALLKATAPKAFGTGDFFLMLVMARTQSSISASCSSSGVIHVKLRWSM
jgi:hypothetical protein